MIDVSWNDHNVSKPELEIWAEINGQTIPLTFHEAWRLRERLDALLKAVLEHPTVRIAALRPDYTAGSLYGEKVKL